MADIIDAIDALVDEQLAQESSGYDHNINQPKCWHCGRDWHGMPIIERVERMRRLGWFDESYRVAEDDSPMLCRGSDFIGPQPWPADAPWVLPHEPDLSGWSTARRDVSIEIGEDTVRRAGRILAAVTATLESLGIPVSEYPPEFAYPQYQNEERQ